MLWWLSTREGCDAVGINCKNGGTANNQGAGVKYVGKECVTDGCACAIWPNMTTAPRWRESHGILILLFNKRD